MKNVWIGVTITDRCKLDRILSMKEHIKAPNYFLTFVPLFEDMGEFNLNGIGWVVIGTETGNRKGKITAKKEWILNILRQVRQHDLPIFMKSSLWDIVGANELSQDLPISFTKGSNTQKIVV